MYSPQGVWIIPYGRTRFAHPGKMYLFKRLPTPCTEAQSICFFCFCGFAQSFSQPSDFVLLWRSHAFCHSFSGCRGGSQLVELHTLKNPVQGPCTPCWPLISGRVWHDHTMAAMTHLFCAMGVLAGRRPMRRSCRFFCFRLALLLERGGSSPPRAAAQSCRPQMSTLGRAFAFMTGQVCEHPGCRYHLAVGVSCLPL